VATTYLAIKSKEKSHDHNIGNPLHPATTRSQPPREGPSPHQLDDHPRLDGIGDRGIDRALDAIEAALKEDHCEDHRHTIEHCCYVPPPIQRRLKELGVLDASANGFLYDLGDAYKANRGEEEMRWMWPHRTLIDEGIPAPGHSDCPVCSPNPWLGIYGLVTRKTSGGDVLYAGEGITPMEAIRAYTILGAFAAWEEDIKGSVEPGKLADPVVIDRDPLAIPNDDLKNVETVMTIIDGKIVYRRCQNII